MTVSLKFHHAGKDTLLVFTSFSNKGRIMNILYIEEKIEKYANTFFEK